VTGANHGIKADTDPTAGIELAVLRKLGQRVNAD